MRYLIANWKQNKKITEGEAWVHEYLRNLNGETLNSLSVIIAPPFTLLGEVIEAVKGYSKNYIQIGVQNVSKYQNGANTGEVGVEQLPVGVEWVILGHSERRKDGETIDMVNEKISVSVNSGLSPIVCFSNISEYSKVSNKGNGIYFAYEPIEAIGTGDPATLDNLNNVYSQIEERNFIYGGSVNSDNIGEYSNIPYLNGFLVGGASLDPVEFAKITLLLNKNS